MNKALVVPILGIILLLIDWYVFQAVKTVLRKKTAHFRRNVNISYWTVTALVLLAFVAYYIFPPHVFPRGMRYFMIIGVTMVYFSKLFAVAFLMLDDLIRLFRIILRPVWSLFFRKVHAHDEKHGNRDYDYPEWEDGLLAHNQADQQEPPGDPGEGLSNERKNKLQKIFGPGKITRSQFLAKSAILAGALPMATMTFGILSGAHNYRIHRLRLRYPELPPAFHGIKIIQISDIHSGSFYNKKAVKGGVDMLLDERPDLVFFTGDLVNDETREVDHYIDVFQKIKAPLGVFSTTGNHDYGDYRMWPSPEAKAKNFQDLIDAHRLLGWDLLMNEHRLIEVDGEQLPVIGIENWGTGRFPKYGDLEKASNGIEDRPFKILLSHDPSHWDAQVRPEYPDINLMLAGHTHGFQFGLEAGGIKWSPSQWVYKQWAGLYREGNQDLYVNRGYGFIGYPGRIGILPEITVIELEKS